MALTSSVSVSDTKVHASGSVSKLLAITLSGTYATNGVAVALSSYFAAIKRARMERALIDSDGNIYTLSYSGTTLTIKIWEFATGGLGPTEMSNGQALSSRTVYAEVEGPPVNHVSSDPW